MSSLPLSGKVCLVSGAGDATFDRIAEQGGIAIPCGDLEVTSESAWAELIAGVGRDHGRLDGLVNVAAIGSADDAPEDWSAARWRDAREANLTGPVLGIKHAVALMRELSIAGSIVNVGPVPASSDAAALIGETIRGGLRMLTQSTAWYCNSRAQGIRCNAVHPGHAERDDLRQAGVAATVAFLLSDDAGFITGSEFTVGGGCRSI